MMCSTLVLPQAKLRPLSASKVPSAQPRLAIAKARPAALHYRRRGWRLPLVQAQQQADQAAAAPAAAAPAELVRVDVPLELEQYDSDKSLPLNTYSPKAPFTGKIVSVRTLTGPRAKGEVCHITIQTDGQIPFVEGQSYGIIPPAEQGTKVTAKGKVVPQSARLYTIASTRYGDSFDGKTASLCVRRAAYVDPETGVEDAAKKGVCSNYLCDAQPGLEVSMTGPTGKVLLLPADPCTNVIMVATGSGIAPYRTFWRRMFVENVPNYQFKGLAWLFMGAANADGRLYHEELEPIVTANPTQFRLDYALSREQKNKRGGKMYIQDKVEEYAEEVFDLLKNGAHIYFCGLKGMMPGILDMLERVAGEQGLSWQDFYAGLKERNQFHVEVY